MNKLFVAVLCIAHSACNAMIISDGYEKVNWRGAFAQELVYNQPWLQDQEKIRVALDYDTKRGGHCDECENAQYITDKIPDILNMQRSELEDSVRQLDSYKKDYLLYAALRWELYFFLELLLKNNARIGTQELKKIVESKNQKVITLVVQNNVTDFFCKTDFLSLLIEAGPKVVRYFVKACPKIVYYRDRGSNTLLHYAYGKNELRLAWWLERHEANKDAYNNLGRQPRDCGEKGKCIVS